jgi:hypothetical protein
MLTGCGGGSEPSEAAADEGTVVADEATADVSADVQGAVSGESPDGEQDPAPPFVEFVPSIEQSEALEVVDANLERLANLQTFSVGELISDVPDEAYGAYGLPREDWQAVFEAAEADAAVKLAELTEQSEQAVDAMYRDGDAIDEDACAEAAIDANLGALRALQVVAVGQLLVEQPEASENCYGLPCTEEVQRAQAVTCERATRLDRIVRRVTR